jgi:hypothetical protein
MFDLASYLPPPPTAEQQRAWAEQHLGVNRPFRIEAWPARILALAGPLTCVPLTALQRDALFGRILMREGDAPEPLTPAQVEAELAALLPSLDAIVAAHGGSVFVRLGTRSPKDNFEWLDEAGRLRPATSGAEVLSVLLGSMERMFEDLQAAQQVDDSVCLVLRPYRHFRPDQEFRLFIEDGQIAGMSQYFHQMVFPDLGSRADATEAALRAFATAFIALAPWPSFTVDVWMDEAFQVSLIEVNPPVSAGRTDPALFVDHPLDGSFRYLVAPDSALP